MKVKCSRCNRPIDGFVVRLESSITVFKLEPSGILTPYTNFEEPTSEMLCPSCFEEYSKCLNQLNENAQELSLDEITQIIDDIQFSDSFEDLGVAIEEDVCYDSALEDE